MNLGNVKNKNAQTVKVKVGKNPKTLYEHQAEAMVELNKINKRASFNSLLVLPTGGGKTLTAAYWLIKNAIDNKKKVIWVAHRHLLLDQAASAFVNNCYSDTLLKETEFRYRIISGVHDKPIHIKSSDDVLIVSKDSIYRNFGPVAKWLKNNDVYLVIDEAHHATAKSYRRIIEYTKNAADNVKLLGLTATPFRTSEKEKGLLGKIFTDDIVYSTDLVTMINKGILSTPVSESCETRIEVGDSIGINALRSIESLDLIPEDIAQEIACNSNRNKIIVNRYLENYKEYGPTLVFAVNRTHAFSLKALFNKLGEKFGIKAGVIVSGTRAEFTGVEISSKENLRQIEAYRNGDLQVLINVNILTEGTDLPKTQTVFLTRPTVSTVLMTQMIGRALRGERAGGTSKAYIVSFIDDWNNKIAWVNPETLISEGEFENTQFSDIQGSFRTISIKKIEEFARLIDDTVDTKSLESIDFLKRVPLGMYMFDFIDDNELERNHQILVYDSTQGAYQDVMNALPEIFEEYGIVEETIEKDVLEELICKICNAYFNKNMIPPYNKKDIRYLLKFYAQKETEPLFVSIDELSRRKVDLSTYAKVIVQEDMRRSQEEEYINSLWDDEDNLIRVYFGNKLFFKKQLQIEVDKIFNPEEYTLRTELNNYEDRNITELPLEEIRKESPEYYSELSESVHSRFASDDGFYLCAACGKTSKIRRLYQIDHIKPMSKGGLSIPENLQLLCIYCNMKKGDSY